MSQLTDRITDYVTKFPEVRPQYVAGIFNVSPDYVYKIKKQAGAHDARKTASIARNIKAADLDDMILQAVYKRGLVDMVLDGTR